MPTRITHKKPDGTFEEIRVLHHHWNKARRLAHISQQMNKLTDDDAVRIIGQLNAQLSKSSTGWFSKGYLRLAYTNNPDHVLEFKRKNWFQMLLHWNTNAETKMAVRILIEKLEAEYEIPVGLKTYFAPRQVPSWTNEQDVEIAMIKDDLIRCMNIRKTNISENSLAQELTQGHSHKINNLSSWRVHGSDDDHVDNQGNNSLFSMSSIVGSNDNCSMKDERDKEGILKFTDEKYQKILPNNLDVTPAFQDQPQALPHVSSVEISSLLKSEGPAIQKDITPTGDENTPKDVTERSPQGLEFPDDRMPCLLTKIIPDSYCSSSDDQESESIDLDSRRDETIQQKVTLSAEDLLTQGKYVNQHTQSPNNLDVTPAFQDQPQALPHVSSVEISSLLQSEGPAIQKDITPAGDENTPKNEAGGGSTQVLESTDDQIPLLEGYTIKSDSCILEPDLPLKAEKPDLPLKAEKPDLPLKAEKKIDGKRRDQFMKELKKSEVKLTLKVETCLDRKKVQLSNCLSEKTAHTSINHEKMDALIMHRLPSQLLTSLECLLNQSWVHGNISIEKIWVDQNYVKIGILAPWDPARIKEEELYNAHPERLKSNPTCYDHPALALGKGVGFENDWYSAGITLLMTYLIHTQSEKTSKAFSDDLVANLKDLQEGKKSYIEAKSNVENIINRYFQIDTTSPQCVRCAYRLVNQSLAIDEKGNPSTLTTKDQEELLTILNELKKQVLLEECEDLVVVRVSNPSRKKGFPLESSEEKPAPVLDNQLPELPSSPPLDATPLAQSPVAESPVTESPVTESPVTESPVTESPVTESPVTESPVTESPVAQSPVAQSTSPQPQEGIGFFLNSALAKGINSGSALVKGIGSGLLGLVQNLRPENKEAGPVDEAIPQKDGASLNLGFSDLSKFSKKTSDPVPDNKLPELPSSPPLDATPLDATPVAQSPVAQPTSPQPQEGMGFFLNSALAKGISSGILGRVQNLRTGNKEAGPVDEAIPHDVSSESKKGLKHRTDLDHTKPNNATKNPWSKLPRSVSTERINSLWGADISFPSDQQDMSQTFTKSKQDGARLEPRFSEPSRDTILFR